jgi:hypothetical protein
MATWMLSPLDGTYPQQGMVERRTGDSSENQSILGEYLYPLRETWMATVTWTFSGKRTFGVTDLPDRFG